MDPLVAFFITLVLITVFSLWYRITPFFTLIGGAILFGLLAGMTPDATMLGIVEGVGRVFSAFGIIILCGAIIAKLMEEQKQTEEIVSDIRRVVHHPPVIAGSSGYLLSVPVTCCVTSYIMLIPIIECIGKDRTGRTVLLYLAAVGGVISYALIYPTPVVIPLFGAFSRGISPLAFDAVSVPLSLAVLGAVLLYFRFFSPYAATRRDSSAFLPSGTGDCITDKTQGIHWRAWAPFIVILLAIPVSLFLLKLSHVSMINIIMLAGTVTAISLAPPAARTAGLSRGAKHGGFIIFDICGAGALGFVIVQSGFASTALNQMTLVIPVILVPFFLAALIETAQGSRVVTAVIAAEVLAKSPVISTIHPIPLILLISAGACIVSYVTDPFFWLVQRTTGDDIRTVVRYYTLPIALAGILILIVAVTLQYLVFR
ncbi:MULTISPECIES: GntP family permease [unclassified Methanoregula]|uniref:GntP family permease n=1 Tax=unclassified Methanoregula TaxID=2649730 RepID=UPI0009D4EDB7|nr:MULTISPECIES: GntP family permease [unclassified Methanoregula]OPX62053.1 MAG: putative transporter [Methanoregula sp. PtaB.Bin085]OPY36570.1 MAG: putative transporter [Methanoregula sp. PtaU1.Bin006]